MTTYLCSICKNTHDTAKDPPCPQIIATFPVGTMPESPDPSRPSWDRTYFCPQCPPHSQPRDGFGVTRFMEHVFSHATAHLQEAADDARRYHERLQEIEGILALPEIAQWPAHALRREVGVRIALALHSDDEELLTSLRERMRTEASDPTKCSACGKAT